MTTVITSRILFWHIRAFMDVSKVFSQNAKVVSSDEDIIRQVREGKSHFFEQIVERYSDKMFKYLYYYFNFNGALAEDVVQGLFIKLWENLDKYDPGQKFSTWLYRLAHNYTIDWLRKNEKEQQTYAFSQLGGADEDSGHNFVENFVVSDENISNNTDSLIKRELLKGCLSELSGKYKDVVLLFYFEQKSYDEIAYIMDINLPHVGTLLLRAKQQLKTVIQATAGLKEALDFDL